MHDSEHPNLGICFAGQQLFYAVDAPGHPGALTRLGAVDFNFDVTQAFTQPRHTDFSGIQAIIRQLKEEYDIGVVRLLTLPHFECWTTLPKLVYDKADEREDHLSILMKGVERRDIEPIWFSLSNQDYKFLAIRNKKIMAGYERITGIVPAADYVSDFELGQRWINHHPPGGSFLCVSCHPNLISVSSFVLGKLRGATYIKYDDVSDLPFLWMQHAEHLKWLQGLHEQIYLFGTGCDDIVQQLKPHWDKASRIVKMNTLDKMRIEADETTYSFDLARAFPAIMLALEL